MTTTATEGGDRVGRSLAADDIRPLRTRLGLTRADLARRSGVSLAMVANFEMGVVPKRSRALERVLATLHSIVLVEPDGPTDDKGAQP